MIFSTKTISSCSFNMNNTTKNNNNDFSLFNETLDMISEEQKTFRVLFYNEGFKEFVKDSIEPNINFGKLIKNIIKGFMDILDKIWNRFHAFLLDFTRKSSVIKRYKNKLETIEKQVYYPETRYIYTNLGTSTSYTTFRNEMDKEFSNLILNMSKLHDFNTYEKLVLEIERIKDEIDMTEDYFDKVRGNIISSNTSVKKQEFVGELYKYFRNNSVQVTEGYILPQEIKLACDEYFSYDKKLKQLQRDRQDLKNAAKELEKNIMNVNLKDYVREDIPKEAQTIFTSILQNKVKRVNEMCNIYLQVFSIKLDAIKDSYQQYSKILMFACKEIVKEGI